MLGAVLCIAHHNSTHAATPFPPQCRPLNFSGRALWRKSSILKWEYAAFRTKGLCPVCTSGCFSTPRGRFRCRVCCHNASYQRLFFTLSHFSIDHIFLISLTTTGSTLSRRGNTRWLGNRTTVGGTSGTSQRCNVLRRGVPICWRDSARVCLCPVSSFLFLKKKGEVENK